MYQIIAIGSKHAPELSLYFGIQHDAVNVRAVNVILAALGSPVHIGIHVAAGAVIVVLIFALAHSRPRGHPETAP